MKPIGLQSLARALDLHHRVGDRCSSIDVARRHKTFGEDFPIHHFALTNTPLSPLSH